MKVLESSTIHLLEGTVIGNLRLFDDARNYLNYNATYTPMKR